MSTPSRISVFQPDFSSVLVTFCSNSSIFFTSSFDKSLYNLLKRYKHHFDIHRHLFMVRANPSYAFLSLINITKNAIKKAVSQIQRSAGDGFQDFLNCLFLYSLLQIINTKTRCSRKDSPFCPTGFFDYLFVFIYQVS
jgi:hypothetical protein